MIKKLCYIINIIINNHDSDEDHDYDPLWYFQLLHCP